jgi:predicted  nucleic acid-binding Zn-ribbon protein
MLETVRCLLVVQEYDLQIREIEKNLHDIPLRQKARSERLEQQRRQTAAAETALKEKQSAIKQVELDVETRRERIRKLRQQQMEAKTNKEFAAINEEIKQVEEHVREVEDRELVLMEELETLRDDVARVKAALAKEEKVVQQEVNDLEARSVTLKSEAEQVRSKRAEAAAAVARDWLEVYDRLMTRRDRAIVAVVDSTCGGCHMRLPPAVYHNTRRTGMVACDFCGRLLYSE